MKVDVFLSLYVVPINEHSQHVPIIILSANIESLMSELQASCFQMDPVRVLVTGAAGQIAYSLILQIGKGDLFGPSQPIILHLLDIAPAMGILEGVVMEIEDCALPLIQGLSIFLCLDNFT